jgi:hypothetical protein
MAPSEVWKKRLMRFVKLAAYAGAAGLFIGALFAVPQPYTEKIRGHAHYARMVITDDETRAGAMTYVNTRVALLPTLMGDIR